MKVLLITKPTNYEQYGSRIRKQVDACSLDAFHLSDLEKAHNEHYSCLEKVRNKLDEISIEYVQITRGQLWPVFKYDAIITVGGDGTLLSASHGIYDNTPVIGFKSSTSSVGYLCVGDESCVDKTLSDLKASQLEFSVRKRLSARVVRLDIDEVVETAPILNDILFANLYPAAVTRYKIKYNGRQEVHKSSGVWISTATGSTAAISAAGGKVYEAKSEKYQFLVREVYTSDGSRPNLQHEVFEFPNCSLSIENHCSRAILAQDGERGVIHLHYGDVIEITEGPDLMLALSEKERLDRK